MDSPKVSRKCSGCLSSEVHCCGHIRTCAKHCQSTQSWKSEIADANDSESENGACKHSFKLRHMIFFLRKIVICCNTAKSFIVFSSCVLRFESMSNLKSIERMP